MTARVHAVQARLGFPALRWCRPWARRLLWSRRGPHAESNTGSRVSAAMTVTRGMSRPAYPRLRRNGTGKRTSVRRPTPTVTPLKATAGRAVAFSGVTVGVGLLTLVLLPVPFLRSLGYAGLLIPLVTVIAALTLLPVLLSAWGPRLDHRSRRAQGRHQRNAGKPSRAWTAWTRAVIHHRVFAITAALIVLVVLLAAASGLRVGEARPTSLARVGSAEQGLRILQREGFPVGVLSPMEILVPDRANPQALAVQLRTIAGVDTVIAPSGPAWQRSGMSLIDVLPSAPTSSAIDNATVSTVRATVLTVAPGAQVAGDGPSEVDIVP